MNQLVLRGFKRLTSEPLLYIYWLFNYPLFNCPLLNYKLFTIPAVDMAF